MIEIKNLRYKDILNIDNITFNKNYFHIINGASGSGKTSLFRLILGQDFEYEGSIKINGLDIKYTNTQAIRNQIIFLSQNESIFSSTIKEEFEMVNDLLCLKPKDIEPYLEMVCLDKPIDTEVAKLSGGERQRLILARTLYLQRKVYILDEPLSGVDENTSIKILENLNNFQKRHNSMFIMTTHSPNVIEKFNFNILDMEVLNGHH